MAYYDPNEEDPNNPNASSAPQTTGPQSSTISGQGASPTQSSAPQAKTPDNPGNFVGIQQYLAQNKPQAAKLGETVSNYVTDQGSQASQALAQGQTKFNEDVGQNTVGLNEDLFNQAKQTPEQVAADEAKKAEFKKMRDAQYQGPNFLEETDYYQPINMQIQNALGTANNTQTATGRSELLGDIAKQNNQKVSRGASNLDSALLSVSPNSRETLAQARQSVLPLQDQETAASQADAQKAAAAKSQTEATQKAIQDAFAGPTGVQGQLQSSLEAKSKDAATKAGTDADAILELLKAGNKNISDEQLGLLGITRNQYNGLVNDQQFYKDIGKKTNLDDLTKFATKQSPDNLINPQNIASKEDYARYSALNDLMDTSNGFLSDPSQAGTAKTDALDFNFDAAPNALNDRINSFKVENVRSAFNAGKQDPVTMAQMNSIYNMDAPAPKGGSLSQPEQIASMAIEMAQEEGLAAKNPNEPVFSDNVALFNRQLSGLEQMLKSVNDAYGTKIEVPNSYVQQAKKMIVDNLSSAYNKYGSPEKVMPSEDQIVKTAQIAAYTTFLNKLAGEAASVRAPIGQIGPLAPMKKL